MRNAIAAKNIPRKWHDFIGLSIAYRAQKSVALQCSKPAIRGPIFVRGK
jgi:hypothetical protein